MAGIASKIVWSLLFISATVCCGSEAKDNGAVELIREDRDKSYLTTPVLRYQNKKGQIVLLVGSLPLGEKSYYQEINKLVEPYHAVLFECLVPDRYKDWWSLIRQSKTGRDLTAQERYRLDKLKKLGGFRQSNHQAIGLFTNTEIEKLAEVGQMSKQNKDLDYCRENFVCADLPWLSYIKDKRSPFAEWMPKKLRSVFLSQFDLVGAPALDPMTLLLIELWNDSLSMKSIYLDEYKKIPRLLQHPQTLKEQDFVVLQKKRSNAVLKILDECLLEPWITKVAMIYGISFLPDLNEGLLKRGFKLQQETRLPAVVLP